MRGLRSPWPARNWQQESEWMARSERVLSALLIMIVVLTLGFGAALLFQLSRGFPVGVETAPAYSDSVATGEI